MNLGKQFVIYAVACSAAALLSGCGATTIPSPAFEEQIFDAETGAPLEGVNVVAIWELREQNIHGTTFKQFADIREAVTDKDGRFSIPAVTIKNPKRYVLSDNPLLLVFKSGYKTLIVSRPCKDGKCNELFIVGAVGQNFRMIKIHRRFLSPNPDPQNVASLGEPYSNVRSALYDVIPTCSWTHIPKFIEAAVKERERLESLMFRIEATGLPNKRELETSSRYCQPGAPEK